MKISATLLCAGLFGLGAVDASPASAAAPAAPVLLLVHGYSDTCDGAFDETDVVPNTGPDASTTVAYLQRRGWGGNIDQIGYYNPALLFSFRLNNGGTGHATDATRSQSAQGRCDHNLYTFSAGNPRVASCPAMDPQRGTINQHIQALGCELAWYIHDQYTAHGRPVVVLAHSMGGLVIRDAIGESGRTRGFPPRIDVTRVVTVATPHGGLKGAYLDNARQQDPSTEVEDMAVTSGFMRVIGSLQRPQGLHGTFWALIGAAVPCALIGGNQTQQAACFQRSNVGRWPNGDGVVQAESAMAMVADYKILYGVGTEAGPNLTFTADASTEYAHEAKSCGIVAGQLHCLWNPFYLNDARPGTVSVWLCQRNCTANIADMTSNGNGRAPYSLGAIAALLPATAGAPVSARAAGGAIRR